MTMNLKLKIFLLICPVAIVSIAIISIVYFQAARRTVYDQAFDNISFLLDEIKSSELERREAILNRNKLVNLDFFVISYKDEAIRALDEIARQHGGLFLIVDRGNSFVYSSNPDLQADSIVSTLADRGDVKIQQNNYLYLSTTFKPWGWKIFYFTKDSSVKALVKDYLSITLSGLAVSIFLTISLSYILTAKFLVKPILALKTSAYKISQQDFAGRIDINTEDEFGQLARSMERMAADLKQHSEEQKKLNREISAINDELKVANNALDKKVQERTEVLEELNGKLRDNLISLEKQLEESNKKRYELVAQLSDISLKKSDLVQLNARVVNQLAILGDEKKVMMEQIKSYASMLSDKTQEYEVGNNG